MGAARMFLLWSNHRHGWWHYSHMGYTTNQNAAARFTAEEACRIALQAAMDGTVGMAEVIVVAPLEYALPIGETERLLRELEPGS